MAQRRQQLQNLVRDLHQEGEGDFISREEMRLIKNGGFLASDDSDEGESDVSASQSIERFEQASRSSYQQHIPPQKNLQSTTQFRSQASQNEQTMPRQQQQQQYQQFPQLAYSTIGGGGSQQESPSASVDEVDALNVKAKYMAIISMVEKQNTFLSNEINRLKVQYETEKHILHQDRKRAEERFLDEIKTLRAKTLHAEGQIPLIKDALTQVRAMLAGLVPENVYLRLRDLEEKDLPTNDWILVNIWELIYPFKKESDQQKMEINQLRENSKFSADKQNQILNELEHTARMLKEKEDDDKRHMLNYENARRNLELELIKQAEELDILRDKGASFDELNRKFKQVEQEKFLLEEKIGFYNSDVDGKNLLADVYKTTDDLRRKNDMLLQDKDYLLKEASMATEKNKRLEDRVDRLEKDLIEAKNQAQEYLFQLLNQKNASNVDFENRLNKEMMEVREKHNYELETVKNNLVEIYEKQLRFLRDTKDEIEIKCNTQASQLIEKQNSYEMLIIDNRTLQKRVESDMAELRIQIRFKEDELERISNLYEENLTNIKAQRLENEMLRDKMNVLRNEYYKSENSQKEDYAQLKSELAVSKEQLRNYENMEKEIDDAVAALGQSNEQDQVYLQTVESAHTSGKRRVRQAVNLAQSLLAKKKEADLLSKQLKMKSEMLEATQNELRVNHDLIEKASQPYSMIVNHIEEKEREILQYKQALHKSDRDYHTLKAEYNNLKEQYGNVESDVKKLLIRRENITNIQKLLVRLAQSDRESMQTNVRDILTEIQEILSNKPPSLEKMKKTDILGNKELGGSQLHSAANQNSFAPGNTNKDGQVPFWAVKLKAKKPRV